MGGFPGGSDDKESACNAKDLDMILGSGRSPEEGNGYPLQYSCLENHMGREVWWATVHRVTKSRTGLKQLSTAHTEIKTRMEDSPLHTSTWNSSSLLATWKGQINKY